MIRAISRARAWSLGIAAFIAISLVLSLIRERSLEMLAGNAFFFALLALVFWAGIREQRHTHVTDTAQLLGRALSFTSPSWSGAVTPEQVVKVKQLRRNPMEAKERPSPEWRHWIRVDLLSGAQPGATRLYFWSEHPVTLLNDLASAGFPVKGAIEEPQVTA